MAKDKVRWAMLCTARINRAVIPPIRASARSELVAVGSRSLETGQAYARKWDIPRAHGSYDALLADPEVDAVYIGLPNGQHAEWAIRCAEAGKHVLCEKPLATTVEDAERMYGAAQRHGTVLAEAFMYRHHPQTHLVFDLINQGRIGPVRVVHGNFSFFLEPGDDIRLNPKLDGGSLWDLGCYPVSYTRTMLGQEPVEVIGRQHVTAEGVDTTFAGMLRFPSGALAVFDCGFRAPDRWGMEFVGEEGSLNIPSPFKPTASDYVTLRRGGTSENITAPPMELYFGEIEDMADAILNGKPSLISREDSVAGIRSLVALYQSAREGRPVAL